MKAPIRFVKVGRKKIQVWHDNFEYYQPNDHECGDCGIRAVAKALDCSWEDSLTKLFGSAIKIKEAPGSCDNITETLKEYGFKWVPVKPERGSKRPTVSEFAKNHDGTYILRVSGHVVCAKDGKYYDIWDSGSKSLYGYWVKEKPAFYQPTSPFSSRSAILTLTTD